MNTSKKMFLESQQQVLAVCRSSYGDVPHQATGEALSGVAKAMHALGLFQEALTIRKNIYKEKIHEDLSNSNTHIGKALADLKRHEEALEAHKEALRVRLSLHGEMFHPKNLL